MRALMAVTWTSLAAERRARIDALPFPVREVFPMSAHRPGSYGVHKLGCRALREARAARGLNPFNGKRES